jgi:hypothetical protein
MAFALFRVAHEADLPLAYLEFRPPGGPAADETQGMCCVSGYATRLSHFVMAASEFDEALVIVIGWPKSS